MRLDRYSRIAQAAYAVVAAVNLLFFCWQGGIDKLSLALLLGVLIVNQRGLDQWRHAANEWRHAAKTWQETADHWRAAAGGFR